LILKTSMAYCISLFALSLLKEADHGPRIRPITSLALAGLEVAREHRQMLMTVMLTTYDFLVSVDYGLSQNFY